MPRQDLDPAFPYCAHEIFDVMRQVADRLEADGIGRTFQRMGVRNN